MTSARLALLSIFEVAQQPKDEEWEMHGNKLFLETKLIIAGHKITSKNSFPFRLSVKGNISNLSSYACDWKWQSSFGPECFMNYHLTTLHSNDVSK